MTAPARIRPAAAQVNSRIRQLMDEPMTGAREEEYRQLLVLWSAATERGPASVTRQLGRAHPSSSNAMDTAAVATPQDTCRSQARSPRCRSGCALA